MACARSNQLLMMSWRSWRGWYCGKGRSHALASSNTLPGSSFSTSTYTRSRYSFFTLTSSCLSSHLVYTSVLCAESDSRGKMSAAAES